MSTRALVTIFQQSQRMLDKIGPQLSEEANKKIAEIKQKIPNETSIKQMMMDEITSKGPELVCSIEVKNRIDKTYRKLKAVNTQLQFILDKSSEKILAIQKQLNLVIEFMAKVTAIFGILRALVPVLTTIVITAKVAIKFLKGLAADVDTGLKLKDLIDKSKAKQEEIKNSLEVFTEKLTKISAITTSIGTVISTVLALIFPIKGKITSLNGVIESFYLKHTLMCDVEGESMEDEAYAAAVNEAQNSLNSTLSNEDAEITFIEEDLQPNTIERIRNANFEVIQYRIA